MVPHQESISLSPVVARSLASPALAIPTSALEPFNSFFTMAKSFSLSDTLLASSTIVTTRVSGLSFLIEAAVSSSCDAVREVMKIVAAPARANCSATPYIIHRENELALYN